jgi:hypothetical protein
MLQQCDAVTVSTTCSRLVSAIPDRNRGERELSTLRTLGGEAGQDMCPGVGSSIVGYIALDYRAQCGETSLQ